MNRGLGFVLSAVLLAIAPAASAADIEIIQPWVRANPGSQTGALYFTLHNRGPHSDRLVGASTPLAKNAQLHATMEQGDVTRMEKIDGVEIAAGGSVPFWPGGLHVMLTGLDRAAAPGTKLPIALRFERSGEIELAAPILPPGASPPSPGTANPGATGHGAHTH